MLSGTNIQEKFNSRCKGKQSTSHFTGIIITRKDEKGQGLPKYQILDGQQRLTTFQIILCVIRDLCKSKTYTLRAESADLLIKNEGYSEKYKLYPKEGFDEKAFHALVNSEPGGGHVMHRAYDHFMNAIIDQIGTDSENIDHLYNAITNDFHMVQIDLKKGDEPEKVFASLNATGRMLDEFDHLRNDLFLKAEEAGEDLYDTCWNHFDTDSYWENSENLDLFLRHFLEATVDPACFPKDEGKDIKAFDVYLKQYRPKLKPDQDIEYEFRKLKRYSKVYQEMNDPDSKFGSRMKFYKEFNIDSLHPFILYIINEFSEFAISEDKPEGEFLLSDDDLELIFDILESYMMRRILRWGREDLYKVVNGINNFLSEIREGKDFSLIDFLNYLAKSGGKRHEDQWPTNREVELALTERWRVEKGIRYILYRIELERRKEKKIPEKIDFTEELILHYVMPDKWENSWFLEGPDGPIQFKALFSDEYKAKTRSWFDRPSQQGLIDESYLKAFTLAQDRKNRRRSIGNLTFVDEVSAQTKFDEKKQYFADSKFIISKDIVNDYENWDASQIDDRAEKLIKYFHEIWKYSNCYRKEYLSTKYCQGAIVRGTVAKISNTGIYLQLEEGIEGKIVLSEMTWTKLPPKSVDFSEFANIDDEIEAKVLEISNHHRQIPLSLKQLKPNPWENLEQKYSVGMKITGYITHIHDFGALVKIDQQGIEGRIYNDDLSWDPRSTARELLKKGDEVEVEVLRIDISKQLILLGHKQTKPDPWDEVPEKYKVGSVVPGQIVDLTNFGAFVKIEKGIEGLIHISELTSREIEKPEEVVSVGEKLDVKVIHLSPEDRHIRLSLKAMHSDECNIHQDSSPDKQWNPKPMKDDEPITAITYNGQKALPQKIKPDILFSCSKTAWQTLNSVIKVREDVRKMLLSPIKSPKKILRMLDSLLASGQEKKVYSLAVTRAGHELYGTIENFNQNKIGMRIGEAIVTVYRHGLIEFSTVEYHQGKITEFDNRNGEGFIQSNELPRISVSISEVCGENTMPLVGKSVEFEICQTLHGLEARNVVLIKK